MHVKQSCCVRSSVVVALAIAAYLATATAGDLRRGDLAGDPPSADGAAPNVTCGTRHVDDTGDDTANDCLTPATPCLTIQHAIDEACAGDTVLVEPGLYNENPVIAKALTLESALGRDWTTIQLPPVGAGPGYLTPVLIQASNVTVDGFTIAGNDATASASGLANSNILVDNNASFAGTPMTGIVVKNNRFKVGQIGGATTGDDGIGLITTYNGVVTLADLTVTDNLFVPLLAEGARAFYINSGVDKFVFQRNTITGRFAFTTSTEAHDGLIENNVLDGQNLGGRGFGCYGNTDATFWGHTVFRGNTVSGVLIGIRPADANDVLLECNRPTGNTVGVSVQEFGGTPGFDPTTIEIHDNAITGNTANGAENLATTSGTVDATGNWWGCAAGPGNAGCDTVSGDLDAGSPLAAVPACAPCATDEECDSGNPCTTDTCEPPLDLVVNGSFEDGTDPGGTFLTLASGSTDITGWTVGGGGVDYIGGYWESSDGSRNIDLSGDAAGSIAQTTLATTPGTAYRLTFDMAGNPDGAPVVKTIQASVQGALTQSATFAFDTTGKSHPSPMGWEVREFVFTADAATTTLTFESLSLSPYGPALDNVRVTEAVPSTCVSVNNTDPCDDDLFCTVGDTCGDGDCTGSPKNCDDGFQCTADSCDEVGDTCVNDPAPLEGSACDDGLFCTVADTCASGSCESGVPRDCSGTSSAGIDFEDPPYSLGTIDGQDGWSSDGAAGSGCAVYDHEVVSNLYGYAEFDAQSLRISNAVTSGCFGDQTFSKSLVDEVGERASTNNGLSGGVRRTHFEAEWSFASTVPGAEQPGLSVVASPDRGDGARMSWVQMTDTPGGLDVNFFDYQDVAPQGSLGDPDAGCGVWDDFVLTPVATGLDRTVPHTIKVTLDTFEGQANDVVKVYVDGVLLHTGGSWEDYFRWCEQNPVGISRTVDSILFRTGGAAAPATLGNGFVIDNLTLSSGLEADQCNAGICNEDTDACEVAPTNEGGSCDDGLFCTVDDSCESGTCTGSSKSCDDGNPCTADSCNEAGDTCVNDPAPLEGSACDDGLFCTVGDTCSAGACTSGAARDCSGTSSAGIDFEDPPYSLGTIDGQDGWSSDGAAGSGCAVYDHEVVSNLYGYAEFDAQSLRISNAVTSGCFGDQTFSKSLVDEVGERASTNNGLSGGVRRTHFEAEWSFASTVPGAEQPGLLVVASPDRGDGARMSWVQMTDTPGGLDVNFFDYQDVAPQGSLGDPDAGCGVGDDFVLTPVAIGLDRTVPHAIRITLDTFEGPANDVVKVYVDGVLEHTGGSWEDYFRWCEQNPVGISRTVDSILFRTAGTAAPATLGNGFVIDNLTLESGLEGDQCNAGVCNEDTDSCEVAPANEGGPCDDGLFCTVDETCSAGACTGSPKDCSGAADNECEVGVCNEDTDACEAASANEGGSCDDGLFCTVDDTCSGGDCSGTPKDCSGVAGQCQVGQCDEAGDACIPVPGNEGGSCEDGDACTENDTCAGGSCDPGTQVNCDDGDDCTTDTCDSQTGCHHEQICCDDPSPHTAGFYQRMCSPIYSGPEPLTQEDVDCVNDSCTFADVQTIDDMCVVLRTRTDSCTRAEIHFMGLLLNLCRGHVCEGDPIDSTCGDNTTVGQTADEIDAMLCDGGTDEECKLAACEANEVNNGTALILDSLLAAKLPGNQVKLTWDEPLIDSDKHIAFYEVWRSTDGLSWQLLGQVGEAKTYVDATMLPGVSYQYDVTVKLQD